MKKSKIKTIFFTIIFVFPLAYFFKQYFPETSKLTAFLLIIFLLIIFHSIGSFIFSDRRKTTEEKTKVD